MSHKVDVKKVGDDAAKVNTMFLVTVLTDYELVNDSIVSNKEDLSNKEILEVEEREVTNEKLQALGKECKDYNFRQEYYLKDDKKNHRDMKTEMNYKYISSVDPKAEKSTEENI